MYPQYTYVYRFKCLADDICVRKDGKTGYCVHLHDCSYINDMVQRKQKTGISLSPDERTYIQNSVCPVRKRVESIDHLPNTHSLKINTKYIHSLGICVL